MPDHPHAALVARFHAAFAALDADAMAACDAIGAMWRMLCEAVRASGRGQWRHAAFRAAGGA